MLHHRTFGTGTPVVILHGVGLDHRYMMDTVEPGFRDAGAWRRIYVDLPGHGLSPGQTDITSMDDVLRAVTGFVDEILPDTRFAVLGLSRGSYIARGILHSMPDRVTGVALILPGGNPGSDPDRLPPRQVLEHDPSIRPELTEAELWAWDNLTVLERRDIVQKRRNFVAPAHAVFDSAQDERVMKSFEFSFSEAE